MGGWISGWLFKPEEPSESASDSVSECTSDSVDDSVDDSVSASPESKSLRLHSASLVTAIADPLDLSIRLFAKEIIEEVTKREVDLPSQIVTKKNSILVSAVIKRVEARSCLFHRFVELLNQDGDHVLRELGGKLETTCNDYAKQSCSSPSSEEQLEYSPPLPMMRFDSPSPSSTERFLPPPLVTHPSLVPHPPESPVCCYASYLRAFYQTSELPVYKKWLQTPSGTFSNLAVIRRPRRDLTSENDTFILSTLHGSDDDILRVKDSIQMEDILSPIAEETLQCVLVEGAPGVGKTTLAFEVCRKWGKGELFQQFAFVILLQLRDQTVQKANSIENLVLYQDQYCQDAEGYRKKITQHLMETNGKDALIILDGLDQLPTHLLTHSSIFTSLLRGIILPDATILITSRPSITKQLWKTWEKRVSQRIEVLGFTQENIAQYITHALPPQELPAFQTFLSSNTYITATMYIPLHTAIIIEVYKWCQNSRRPLPKTITQLYTCFVLVILQQYIDNHPDYKGKEIHLQTIADLPPPVYTHFYNLMQLAHTGVTQQKFVFEDQEKPTQHHLGFMVSVAELFPILDSQQVTYSYNFLHVSIQEYLAAYYISTMEIHQQEQLLQTLKAQTHLQNTSRFLAGITKFKDMDTTTVKKVIEGGSWNTHEVNGEKVTELSTHALRLLFECGDASILDSNQSYECILNNLNPPSDFSSLGYCIAHSNCKWRLGLGSACHYLNCLVRIQTLVQALHNHTSSRYLYSIESIDYHYDAPPESVEHLLTGMPQKILPQLQTLELVSDFQTQNRQPPPQCVPELTPEMSSLHTLKLHYTIQVHKTVQAMVTTNTLKNLTLSDCNLDHECVTTLCQWLSTSSQLETLEITRLPSLATPEMILTAINTNPTLKALDLGSAKFNLQAGQAMCSMLTHNNTLTKLKLCACNIDDDIICYLASGLHGNNTLTTLNIDLNPFSDKGVESIVEVLRSNNTLTTLSLGRNSISDRGAESIAQALQSNSTLTTLNLLLNKIGDEGAVCIAEMLKVNDTLRQVNLSFNKIELRGRMALAEVEKVNRRVEVLY